MKLQIIDMIIILSDYPECITESAKLKAILTDLFPEESKGFFNVMVTIAKSGIAQEIQNSASHDTIGKMETGRWVTRLASEYCMSGDTVNECIGLWVDSLKWLAEQKTGKYCRFGADTPLEEYLYANLYDNTSLDSASALEQWLYVCNKYHNYVGMAYYHLADIWRQIERSISDWRDSVESEESYNAYQEGLEESRNLRAELCNFLKIDTVNCNVIVEKLLLAANRREYEKAIPPLCRAYLYVYDLDGDYGVSSYQDMTEWDVNYGDYEEKPWFDINCMDDDYDTLESEDIVELQEPSPEIREKYVHKALEFFADGRSKSREMKSCMVNVYRIASELMDTDYLKDVLPTLTELADSGDAHFIKLLLRYYEDKNDPSYESILLKYAEMGDYETQCKLAERYRQEYEKTKSDESFGNAYKWYKNAICNSSRRYQTYEMKNLVELLKKKSSAQYGEEIRKLEEEIKHDDGVASCEFDRMMRYQ